MRPRKRKPWRPTLRPLLIEASVLGLIVAIGLLGWIVLYAIARPISAMTGAMDRLAQRRSVGPRDRHRAQG